MTAADTMAGKMAAFVPFLVGSGTLASCHAMRWHCALHAVLRAGCVVMTTLCEHAVCRLPEACARYDCHDEGMPRNLSYRVFSLLVTSACCHSAFGRLLDSTQ